MAQPMQDMPPSQGFPSTIRYQRYIPSRGPSGLILFSLITATTLYGFYEMSFIKNEERQLKNEKAWARIYIAPLLQAEQDRDLVRKKYILKEKEYAIMSKSFPEWSALDLKVPLELTKGKALEPVYYTERYVEPTYIFIPPNDETFFPAQPWRTNKWLGIKNNPYHERWDWLNKGNGPNVPAEELV